MSVHRRASVWIGVLPLIAGAGLARAQPAPASSPPAPEVRTAAPASSAAPSSPDGDAAAARAAHLRGLEARENDDWHRARADFAEAWSHKHHWEIAINLGEAEMRTSRFEEAILHLTFVLQERGFLDRSQDLVEQEKAMVTAWLSEATSKLEAQRAARRPRPATPLKPALEPAYPRAWQIGVGVGAGLTVAGALTSVILFADAASKIDGVKTSLESLPGLPGDPASIRCQGSAEAVCKANVERLRSADAMQAAGGGLLLGSSAIAVATVVYAVLGAKRDGPVLAPAAGSGTVGMAVAGAW